MGGVETLEREDVSVDIVPKEEYDVNGNKRLKHYVIGGADAVLAARVNGFELVALCGFRFKPFGDPSNFPPCKRCVEIEKQLLNDSDPDKSDPGFHLPRRAK